MVDEKKDPFEEKDFEAKLKQSLDNSVDELSQQTLANLNEIRQQALNGKQANASKFQWALWGPAGGLVAAAVVAAVWVGNPAVQPSNSIDDLELLTSEEDLELMEDIEFVAWLMEQEIDHAG
ncbi:MAG: hypothetical protein MI867_27475 [Pseudomonadales bacterium]|nr:hypothetical protein [Pseudomonadales bacterium]